MKRILITLALVCLAGGVDLEAQNMTSVSASGIRNGGALVPAARACFLGTDNQDRAINFEQGGGGVNGFKPYCAAVTSGVLVGGFQVPNPANTSPAGIYYHITIKDSNTQQLFYDEGCVSFSGATFNLDNHTPVGCQAHGFTPPSGSSIAGPFTVNGNLTVTGAVTGSNIPANFISAVRNNGTLLAGQNTLNCLPRLTCTNNAPSSYTEIDLASGVVTPGTNTKITVDTYGRVTATAQAAASDLSDGNTGTGAIVHTTSPAIVTPTIASFANAAHDHSNAAGGGNISSTAVAAGNKRGNGTKFQMADAATPATNDCAKFDANGNITTAGAACTTGAGDNVSVNGTAAADADFDDATPAAPANAINVKWQKDALSPNNLSANVPYDSGTMAVAGGNLKVKDAGIASTQLAVSAKTEIRCVTIFDPVTGDSGRVQFELPAASTVTRVYASVKAATSVTLNWNKRTEATPDVSGTDILSAGLVADTNGQTSCSSGCDVNTITSAAIGARVPVALTISAVTGTPDTLRACVEFTRD